MGDPKKMKKKYKTPSHPWVSSRIDEERALKLAYGTKPKKEIWKMVSQLTTFKDRAKRLLAMQGKQAELEQHQLITRMVKLGLVAPGASIDDILSLSTKSIMDRRLQTLLVKRHLARTVKQARQMIIHRHVSCGGKVITSPSHIVSLDEESTIVFAARSSFHNEQHPERFSEEELARKRQKEEARTKKPASEETVAPTFDEKEIVQAEVLAGERPAEGA